MLLDVKNISKTFTKDGKSKKAVADVSFSLKQGEITVFLGPNGAGKTTTIKLILGLIMQDQGHVLFQGHDLAASTIPLLQKTGALLEGTRNIYWNLSITENFAYWGRYKGLSKKAAIEQGLELLRLFNLENKKDTPVKELSLGMQQTVSICCACLGDPELLILDEPTLGLDVNAVAVMEDVLRKLARERKMAILITTHEMKFAQEIADKMILINHGKLIFKGSLAATLAKFNQQVVYRLNFSRVLTSEEQRNLADLGKLSLGKPDYLLELEKQEDTPTLMTKLGQLPVTAVNRENKTLTDLFRTFVGE
ncbi:ABC transporter ATP-binding protein [Lactobacillus sp. ESL0791]|uniref:ABC transporter ATP-binding protein n=1 Tax=Lactobacillus sp. ESL0791 TaxID=2983234 RepID=UPI0023F72DCC|nr:ABC transporter ATP-binding protein [Lactobacillus sp. ESL0791]MDF7639865.1 ABC transporter ATP-binding protein [Lactobacillus sp. ESL0791]